MRIIDFYLLRIFIKVLVVCFLSLAGGFVVFHTFTNLDVFLAMAEKESGGMASVMGRFYGPRMLTIFDQTSSFLSLMAAVFAISLLRRSNEYTALLAAGVSPKRVAAPLVLAAIVVSALAVANREKLTPNYRDQLTGDVEDLAGDHPRKLQPCYDNRTEILFSGKHVLLARKTIVEPKFGLPITLSAFGKQLTGASARWQEAGPERPSGYRFEKVSHPDNIDRLPSAHMSGEPAVLTSLDTPWLSPGECFVVSTVDVDQIVGGAAWRQYSSTSQLMEELKNPSLELGADVSVKLHARFLQPAMDVTLLFLGLPLALGRENRQLYVVAGLCVTLVAAVMLFVMFCHALGANCLIPPALAAWAPLILFGPAAVWLSVPILE